MDDEKNVSTYTKEDIEKNKTIAGLAYFIFFLPLLTNPESAYGKFHANQGLLLFILGVGGNIILGVIPVIGWLLMLPFGVLVLILFVIGLINGFGGKVKELPVIGKYRIIK
ncbi:Uncharacterized membrane protein [Halolactibacillus halophilus]|uniref:Uncharacterized membrane protein n=1 Tax=Halolactibacillus halophilus TaxID=306540 RepID=A0A1I5T700_9BACI|nr:hypothetical protein [Halolactibacillus halophilus]GEM02939.1 hypothetical protein HHA03_24710 [Halolactibacillus halophilus]SFP78812.1 Uncharacterized membrane protein [Halolactibacillus halophilus]